MGVGTVMQVGLRLRVGGQAAAVTEHACGQLGRVGGRGGG